MTWQERFEFNMGLFPEVHNYTGDDWLNLVTGWKNDDGTITCVVNAKLRPGDKFWLRPKHEKALELAPDYQYSVQRRKTIKNEDGELEITV